jgi:hypothetical protein
MCGLVVIVPSRTRPQSVARLLGAWTDTGATADLVVLVDDDDPTLAEYRAVVEGTVADLIVGPRQRIGPLVNDHALSLAATYDCVGFMGDDHCPRTPGWDERILAESTPWTVVYGDDLLQGARIPTAVFMGTRLIRELGYFNPPGLEHLYLDDSWKTYGQALGTLRYLPDVVIEHLHFVNGKAPRDALYADVNSTEMYDRDRAAFLQWFNGRARGDLERVRKAMA